MRLHSVPNLSRACYKTRNTTKIQYYIVYCNLGWTKSRPPHKGDYASGKKSRIQMPSQ